MKTHRFSPCHPIGNQEAIGQACQATITKDGERRPCRHPAMPGDWLCHQHQAVPCAAVGRLWWCFRHFGWGMFCPSFAPRLRKLARDLPVSLGAADRAMLRLLASLRQWRGCRDDVQGAIKWAAKLERIVLWPGQLHLFGRRSRVPLCRPGVPPKTTLGGTYRPGACSTPLPLCQNSHSKTSTPLGDSSVGLSGPLVQGKGLRGVGPDG